MTETTEHATLAPLQDAPDEILSMSNHDSTIFTIYIDGRFERGPAWTTLDAAAVEFIERLGDFMPGYKLVKRGAAMDQWQPIETAPEEQERAEKEAKDLMREECAVLVEKEASLLYDDWNDRNLARQWMRIAELIRQGA